MSTGTEGRVDLLLTTHHAEHGLLQLLQLLLQGFALLTAQALTACAVQIALGGLERRVLGAAVSPRYKVHNASIVQGPPRMVVHLLGRALDVKDVFLAQVNVLVKE